MAPKAEVVLGSNRSMPTWNPSHPRQGPLPQCPQEQGAAVGSLGEGRELSALGTQARCPHGLQVGVPDRSQTLPGEVQGWRCDVPVPPSPCSGLTRVLGPP